MFEIKDQVSNANVGAAVGIQSQIILCISHARAGYFIKLTVTQEVLIARLGALERLILKIAR